ncbi:MAG: hypothetical protein ACKVZH_08445 [Blastocatellia bacterium]
MRLCQNPVFKRQAFKIQHIVTFVFLLAINLVSFAVVQGQALPTFYLRKVEEKRLPGVIQGPNNDWGVDGNSPAVRDANGNLTLFHSMSFPWRSAGADLFHMTPSRQVTINQMDVVEGGLWLEAVHRDADGTLFGWFHNEFQTGCERIGLGAPRIRQMISYDDGKTWDDMGVVIAAPDGFFNCDTENYYFSGGTGDFSVILDQTTNCFYFYFTTYSPDFSQQGISIARLKYQDRFQPAGKVMNWRNGEWDESALGGKLSPIFPPQVSWHESNLNAFWGPAIHYNAYLNQYVMLLNHAVDARWSTEGFYISFNPNIANPDGWSTPQRLPVTPDSPLQAYPQIFGLEQDGTDRLARQTGRLFLQGVSSWEIVFWEPQVRALRPSNSSSTRLAAPARDAGTPKPTDPSSGRTRQ